MSKLVNCLLNYCNFKVFLFKGFSINLYIYSRHIIMIKLILKKTDFLKLKTSNFDLSDLFYSI